LLGGCASKPAAPPSVPGVPISASVSNVPFFGQKDRYCGPASLAMVLAWSGLAVDQDSIAPEVYTPGREGTLPQDLVSAARRHGRVAVPVRTLSALYAEVAAGHPVLVFQNLGFSWYSDWHFAVVTGYTQKEGTITLHSGTDPDHEMSLSRFERSWSGTDNWGLVVVQPDVVPVSADEPAMIEAAIGLERAGQPRAAAAAYAAAQKRWPDSYGAAIGLGNTSYAEGNFAAAETAFRRATMLRPDAAPAWNNLATVLAKRGKFDAALYTARRAVETGRGGAPYRATQKEIQAKEAASSHAARRGGGRAQAGRAPP
jgi:tetratricopeptide (TPR) repeat protein